MQVMFALKQFTSRVVYAQKFFFSVPVGEIFFISSFDTANIGSCIVNFAEVCFSVKVLADAVAGIKIFQTITAVNMAAT